MTLPRIGVHWTQRETALAPVAVAAAGDRARVLASRLLRRDPPLPLDRLRGAATGDALVVLGEAPDLPWVDGAIYLGKDAKAGSLLVPTNMAPSVPIDALERALAGRFAGVAPPLVVLPAQGLVFSAAPALPLSREKIARWLEENP
jgi:hypothetical protein